MQRQDEAADYSAEGTQSSQTRCALKMGFSASNTKAFIAESLGVSERTVARWFTVYRQHGLDAVLKRGYGIGRPSSELEIEAYLLKGLENARWNTAEQARAELSVHFKRSFSYHQVWHWLKNAPEFSSRPVHEKEDLKRQGVTLGILLAYFWKNADQDLVCR